MKTGTSLIFVLVAKGLFFVLNIIALHLLLRGHNLPGGGFIGGLVTAISLVVLSLALGRERLGEWLGFDVAWLAVAGLGLAAVTAFVPLLFGRALLEHFMWHFRVPLLGEVHAGTPLAFDLGVFLVVVGIATKMIITLGRATEGGGAFGPGEQSRYASSTEEAIEGPGAGPGPGAAEQPDGPGARAIVDADRRDHAG